MLSYKSLFALLGVIGMATTLPIGGGISGSGLPVPTPSGLPEPVRADNGSLYIFEFEVSKIFPPIPSEIAILLNETSPILGFPLPPFPVSLPVTLPPVEVSTIPNVPF